MKTDTTTTDAQGGDGSGEWIDACAADAIEAEGALRFDHGGRTFVVYRNHEDRYFCTDGLCPHEDVHLADGLVMENTIECPKHFSIFDFTTGAVETRNPVSTTSDICIAKGTSVQKPSPQAMTAAKSASLESTVR